MEKQSMIKKLTLKEALEKCRDMYDKLAESGSHEKHSAITLPDDPAMECWCCEYVSQQPGANSCMKNGMRESECLKWCPLRDFWLIAYSGVPCEFYGTTYDKRTRASGPEERRKYAAETAKACTDELSKMEENK